MIPKLWCALALLAVTLHWPIVVAQANADEAAVEAAFNRGVNMQQQGRFQAAIQYYEQALALLPTAPNAPDSDNLLNNLADMYASHHGRQPERAEELYQAALDLRIQRYGLKNRSTLRTLGSLALLSTIRRDWDEATRRYQRLLDLQRQVFPAPSAEVAETLSDLGRTAFAQGHNDKAHRLLIESLRMYESVAQPPESRLLNTLSTLAMVESNMGRTSEADRLLARALAAAQRVREGRTRHMLLSMTYLAMAELARHAGRFGEAEAAYRAVLEIDKNSPELASSAASIAIDLGGLYSQMGLYKKAEAAYQESGELARKWGVSSPNYEMLLALNWGSLYTETGQYAEAEKLLQKARELSTERYGAHGDKTLAVLDNLGVLYMRMQRWRDAAGAFRQESELLTSATGAEHPRVGHSLVNLGAALSSAGDEIEARHCYDRALAILRAKLASTHPELLRVLRVVARLDAAQGHWDEALALLNEARRGTRRHISRELASLSPQEQLQFLINNDGASLTSALSIAAAHRDAPAMRESAVEWVLNSKGVAQEALSQQTREARTASDPRAARLIEELHSVRAQLVAQRGIAAQAIQPPQDLVSRLESLAEQQAELEASLATVSGLAHRTDTWVDLVEVRRALSPGTVLLEVAKTQLFDVSRTHQAEGIAPAHYLAWVVPSAGEGDVQMNDLGPAEAVEAAVAEVRAALASAPADIKNDGHEKAEREVRKPLTALSRLAFEPLLPHLAAAERIVLSPDSGLWLAPWCALLLPDGRYAIEKYDLTYVISGRDLVGAVKPLPTSRPVIFADPDYDLSPAGVQTATRQVLNKAAPQSASPPELRVKLHVDRLPGTADEAKAIAPSLEQLVHARPQIYTDRWALEGVFKALHQPRMLITSTHGLFLPDQVAARRQPLDSSNDSRGPVLDQDGARIENPLLRCGLLLAGCNHAGGGSADDGVLTGLEITGTDLRGTELVVLSACQTGLGDLHRGEGVAGLRQAFQLAGAQTVVATLWEIDDTETVSLMSELFSGLAAGQAKSAALRGAQFKRIAAHRASYGAAHPYYWAAFTLTGR